MRSRGVGAWAKPLWNDRATGAITFMFGIPYVRQDWIDAETAKAAARDPFGHRLHLILGLAWVVLVPGPVSLLLIGMAGLFGIGVFRAYYIHRTWRSFGCHPMLWMMAAWGLWQLLSVQWSGDRDAGWMELVQQRWLWAVWFLWAILPHRGLMIATLVAGFLAANVAQVVHGVGQAFDIPALTFDRHPDRNAGWWQPVVGGSMLTAALGLHLPAAMMGSGKTRWWATAASAATLAGVIATGSRGAWIASAALIVFVAAVAMARWLRGAGKGVTRLGGESADSASRLESPAQRIRLACIVLAITGAVIAAVWLSAGEKIHRRYVNAVEEVRSTLERKDYTTFTGARVLMAKVALRAVEAHPIKGVGAGGYQKWGQAHLQPGEEGYIHTHAHNAYLHIAATTGLVGLTLYLAAMGLALRGAFKGLGERMGTYAAGPGFALIGLLLVGMTDVIQLNAQTSALSYVLWLLCMTPRPAEVGMPKWGKREWGRPFPR